LASLTSVLALAACEPVSPGIVPVHLYLTDAPSEQIAKAEVWISRAYLVPAGEDGAFQTIFPTTEGEEPRMYNLLDLRDGVRALLGDADVDAGEYEQLRLVVDRAEITLVEGVTFADGSSSKTLFVPSGMETGIKVEFGGPITIPDEINLLVDFDVARNFIFLGPPGAPLDVLFTPVLVGTVEES
jgi:hypothetical protein